MATVQKLWMLKAGAWSEVEAPDWEEADHANGDDRASETFYARVGLRIRKTTGIDGTTRRWLERTKDGAWPSRYAIEVDVGGETETLLANDLPSALAIWRDANIGGVAELCDRVATIETVMERLFFVWHGHDWYAACDDCDPREMQRLREARERKRKEHEAHKGRGELLCMLCYEDARRARAAKKEKA